MRGWSGESRLTCHYRWVISKGCIWFWAIVALWGNRKGCITWRTELQVIVPFMKKALDDPRNKGCKFACCLCVPNSRLTPLPTPAGSSQMEVDNSPTTAIRKAGLSPAGGITITHQILISPFSWHKHHKVPGKFFAIRLTEESQCDPRITCGSLSVILWSTDALKISTGFRHTPGA